MKKIMLYVLMFALTIASGFNSAVKTPQNPEVKIKEMSPMEEFTEEEDTQAKSKH